MIQIRNWSTGNLLFEADAASLKLCVELAVSEGVSLNDADLRGAKLNDAKLKRAKLSEAKLNDADLRGADLRGARLNDAYLRGADLRGARLNNADLSYAKLSGARLNDADLRFAKLDRAKLNDAELIRIDGYTYPIILTSTHADIGCEHHTFDEWRNFSIKEILMMDGERAAKFYPALIRLLDFFRPEVDEAEKVA